MPVVPGPFPAAGRRISRAQTRCVGVERPPTEREPIMSRSAPPAAAGLMLLVCLLAPSAAAAGPLRHGDRLAELSVAAVGERTVRIALAPLDEAGQPRPGPASTVLVALKPDIK